MKGGKPIVGALLLVASAYVAYPYVALYQLGQAVRDGNALALRSMSTGRQSAKGSKKISATW